MTVIDILVIILLVVSIFAVLMIINSLKRFNEFTNKVNRDMTEFHNEVMPAVRKLDETLDNTRRITGRIEKRSAEIDRQVESIRESISDTLEKFLPQPGSHTNAGGLVGKIRAFAQGISAFWSAFRK